MLLYDALDVLGPVMTSRFACLALFVANSILLITTPVIAGTVINVPANQPTIQSGINASTDGDTVLVAPGTYTENLKFMGKAITVKSAKGAAVTIIDGGGVAPVVTFDV